ncbi:MAG: DUF3168 domain-containing protein, partial [Dichotomicrobium sp.]
MNALAVQKAVVDALDAALDTPVFDHVPQDQAMPFVSVAAQDIGDADTLTSRAWRHVLTLSVWSEHRGQKEVLEILAEIDGALHDAKLSLESGTAILARIVDSRSRADQDGKTYIGTVTLRVDVV